MTRRLTVLLFAVAAIVLPSSVRAQYIHVWAHTNLDSTQQFPHRVMADCGTIMDSQSMGYYVAVQTECSIYQNGQDVQDWWANPGNPESSVQQWRGSQPGSQYLAHAYNDLEMPPDTFPSTCVQWGAAAGGYRDFWQFSVPQVGGVVPVFTDQGDVFPHGGSTCWSLQWSLVGILWGHTKTAMQVSLSAANVSVSQ